MSEKCQLHEKMELDIQGMQNDIKELFRLIRDTLIQQSSISTDLQTIKNMLKDFQIKLEALATAPSKRWNTLVNSGISAAVGGLVGIIISQLFK